MKYCCCDSGRPRRSEFAHIEWQQRRHCAADERLPYQEQHCHGGRRIREAERPAGADRVGSACAAASNEYVSRAFGDDMTGDAAEH
jgi:hypothetical protein